MIEKQLKRLGFYVILPSMFMPDDENIKKTLIFLFLSIGIFIFAAVIFVKIDTMSQKARSDAQLFSTDLDWVASQYHQTVQNVFKK